MACKQDQNAPGREVNNIEASLCLALTINTPVWGPSATTATSFQLPGYHCPDLVPSAEPPLANIGKQHHYWTLDHLLATNGVHSYSCMSVNTVMWRSQPHSKSPDSM
jgi:hypothetical protein